MTGRINEGSSLTGPVSVRLSQMPAIGQRSSPVSKKTRVSLRAMAFVAASHAGFLGAVRRGRIALKIFMEYSFLRRDADHYLLFLIIYPSRVFSQH